MRPEKYDIKSEVKDIENKTFNSDDERSEISFKISDLKLKQELVELELEGVLLEQERERLKRLRKNSNRRPFIFGPLFCVIILFYGGFFFMILGGPAVGICNTSLSDSAARLYAVEIFLLGVIPTVLIALLMKAVFSATEKKEDKVTEIKFSDSFPIKTIAENLTK